MWGGQEKKIRAIPAGTGYLIAPRGVSLTARTCLSRRITAPVSAGTRLGSVVYYLNDTAVHEVPLIADRNTGKAALPMTVVDALASRCAALLESTATRCE